MSLRQVGHSDGGRLQLEHGVVTVFSFSACQGDECLSRVREHILDSWRQELDVEANP